MSKLDDFFTSYITNSDLQGSTDLIACDKRGRIFIPFAALLATSYPIINQQLILWKDSVAWNSIKSLDDAKLLYEYIVDKSTGLYEDELINQSKAKGESAISSRMNDIPIERSYNYFGYGQAHRAVPFTGFLVGPNDERDELFTRKVIYLTDGTPHVLVIYQHLSDFTLCFLCSDVESPEFTDKSWYYNLQETISRNINPICLQFR